MIESSFEFTVSSKKQANYYRVRPRISFQAKKMFTENWICSNYQTHKSRATAFTENSELIETRGEHNPDF